MDVGALPRRPARFGDAVALVGILQPDLLAEWHVVCQLADAPDFAEACLRDLTVEQANGALTVLVPRQATFFARFVGRDQPSLSMAARIVPPGASGPTRAQRTMKTNLGLGS
jgi:hypothetical protein